MTRFKKYIERFYTNPQQDIKQLRLHLPKLKQCWTEFDSVQSEIEIIDESQAQLTEREEFENTYFDLVTAIEGHIENHSEATTEAATIDCVVHEGKPAFVPAVKLPSVSLTCASIVIKNTICCYTLGTSTPSVYMQEQPPTPSQEDSAPYAQHEEADARTTVLCTANSTERNVQILFSRAFSRLISYTCSLQCLALPTVAHKLPMVEVGISNWKISSSIQLANLGFNSPSRIDMLLGAEIFMNLFWIGQFKPAESASTFQKTTFGWVAFGLAMTADITMMYQQILIDSSQADLQRILWHDDLNSKIKMYNLKTVTFRTASVPFLAIRTLHQLASELSDISQIIYPLGLIGPVILKAKLLMQELWQLQLEWDASLPSIQLVQLDPWGKGNETLEQVEEFHKEISDITAERQISTRSRTRQLHPFLDELGLLLVGGRTQKLQPSRPFLHTGIDFCRPVFVRSSLKQGGSPIKDYVVIFVCLSTKTIHTELVTGLTSVALKLFISRRGMYAHIYIDNATNFVGAHKGLSELYQLNQTEEHRSAVRNILATENIKWHFAPPRSLHFGLSMGSCSEIARVSSAEN
ncbi:hypothetical protein PR048_015564 [Dryococelus australis]|uniref:DUF659 domain-containing protein n=1 Tax=Dryococelus australis TaxID=614101 RepID=A0ABQ9HHA5_9NEOP|nr:hypothetical protein PR048_015564 [Dryococelus australis]